jgi:hypothetical protein
VQDKLDAEAGLLVMLMHGQLPALTATCLRVENRSDTALHAQQAVEAWLAIL